MFRVVRDNQETKLEISSKLSGGDYDYNLHAAIMKERSMSPTVSSVYVAKSGGALTDDNAVHFTYSAAGNYLKRSSETTDAKLNSIESQTNVIGLIYVRTA